jgi:polar amino acid transport system substrate-binding protein
MLLHSHKKRSIKLCQGGGKGRAKFVSSSCEAMSLGSTSRAVPFFWMLLVLGMQSVVSAPIVRPPDSVRSSGEIVFCSDLSSPPYDYFDGTTPAGSDVEIGQAIAALMGIQARFTQTQWSSLVTALQTNKCDAIIAAMSITPQRAQQVDFVEYLSVGLGVLVSKGNPSHIRSIEDLSGKTVAVQLGSYADGTLRAMSKRFQSQERRAIEVLSFPDDIAAPAALANGKVDAFVDDIEMDRDFAKRHSEYFDLAFPGSFAPLPEGIAVRKDNTQMLTSIRQAVEELYKDGRIRNILERNGIASMALYGKVN